MGKSENLFVAYRGIEELIPYARNSRTHSDAQVAQLAASLREFGWTNPVLVDGENGIIAGHGRVLAARKLGMSDVPVIELAHLTEAQKRAYVIADNKLAENAGWNEELLSLEIADLGEMGFDVGLTGFSDKEMKALAPEQEREEATDEVPEPPLKPVTRSGDVWLMGRHRIICGSSTNAADVARVMNGARAALTLTDPPYGLGDTASDKNDYAEYDDTRDNLIKTIAGFFPLAQEVSDVIVLTPGNGNTKYYAVPTWVMAWFTPAGVGRGPWGFCCWQPVLCYGKDPKLAKGKGCHPDAIVHTEAAEKFGHPCTKPINFWVWLMERTSEPGELIYEPFSGSGTTVIAAEQTGRTCYAVELSPVYVDIALRRWQEYTGEDATLEGDGRTWLEVAEEREEA